MNKLSKRKIVMIAIMLIVTVFTISSYSFAYLKKRIETNTKINFQVGTLNYTLESLDLTNNQITIPANSYKNIIINIKSDNEIDSKYKLYYNLLTELTLEEKNKFHIGYSSSNGNTTYEIIRKNESKQIKIVVINKNIKDININFGIEGGLINNEVELADNKIQIEENQYLLDYSGNNYHALLKNGTQLRYDENLNMYALNFDGIDDYLIVPTLPETIDWKNGFTIELEAKWDELKQNSGIMEFAHEIKDGNTYESIGIYNIDNNISLTYTKDSTIGPNILITPNTTNILEKAIHKFEFINNGSGYIINYYKDNSLMHTATTDITILNVEHSNNLIGRTSSEGNTYFHGKIYNLKITEADGDIVLLYNNN